MNTEDLGNSKLLNLLFKPTGLMMGSRVGKWQMNPIKTLTIADIQPGQVILDTDAYTGAFFPVGGVCN